MLGYALKSALLRRPKLVCCTRVQSSPGAPEHVLFWSERGPAVLQRPELVEHALRQTLAADALSLQFKLPPPGVPAPVVQSFQDVASGAVVVEALVVTSVWVVHLLRMLCSVRQAALRCCLFFAGCCSWHATAVLVHGT